MLVLKNELRELKLEAFQWKRLYCCEKKNSCFRRIKLWNRVPDTENGNTEKRLFAQKSFKVMQFIGC